MMTPPAVWPGAGNNYDRAITVDVVSWKEILGTGPLRTHTPHIVCR
jgi:hypothetical protein